MVMRRDLATHSKEEITKMSNHHSNNHLKSINSITTYVLLRINMMANQC
jgi:hypothetical protein